MERLIRILKIINLIQAYPGIKAKDLAAHCETTVRTVYRDLEVISAADIPITNDGHGKGYKFIGNFKQYPINWTEDELNAFIILPGLLGSEYKTQAFNSAYEKVMATIQAEQIERRSLPNDISKVIQTRTGTTPTTEESSLLTVISDAILSTRTIEAVYYSFKSNTIKKRMIDPYFLIPRKDRLYIVGYCHESDKPKTFRLNRFQSVTILNEQFIKDDVNIQKYLKHTWSVIRGDQSIHFKVKFSKNVGRYIQEDVYNVTPTFTPQSDGSLLFEVTVNDDREFMKWIMQYGPDAEIMEPPHYRTKMKEKLQMWSALYL